MMPKRPQKDADAAVQPLRQHSHITATAATAQPRHSHSTFKHSHRNGPKMMPTLPYRHELHAIGAERALHRDNAGPADDFGANQAVGDIEQRSNLRAGAAGNWDAHWPGRGAHDNIGGCGDPRGLVDAGLRGAPPAIALRRDVKRPLIGRRRGRHQGRRDGRGGLKTYMRRSQHRHSTVTETDRKHQSAPDKHGHPSSTRALRRAYCTARVG